MRGRKLGRLSKTTVLGIIHFGEQIAGFIQDALIEGVTGVGVTPIGQEIGDLLGAFLNIFTIVLPDLCYLRQKLHQTGKADEARDGMEIALCVVDFYEKKLQYSGAFRPLYLIRDNELKEFKGDSMPIGIYNDEELSFRNEELNFKENDIIYMFSDGYVDQLGGPDRKTFKSRKFKQLLINIHQKPLHEQKGILEKEYEEWKCDIEQIDDILVMGIRFIKV